MVDTLASGASGGNPVEVQILFSVPLIDFLNNYIHTHVTHVFNYKRHTSF